MADHLPALGSVLDARIPDPAPQRPSQPSVRIALASNRLDLPTSKLATGAGRQAGRYEDFSDRIVSRGRGLATSRVPPDSPVG